MESEYRQHPSTEKLLACAMGESRDPAVGRHLEECSSCAGRVTEMQSLVHAISAIPDREPPREMSRYIEAMGRRRKRAAREGRTIRLRLLFAGGLLLLLLVLLLAGAYLLII